MNEALVEKLQRILALTASPIEGEAQAATAMLQKLLTKHNMEIADLERRGAAVPGVVEQSANSVLGVTRAKWKLELARALAKHFYCFPIVDYRALSVKFVGRPDNVDALEAMFRWLAIQLMEISKEARKEHPEIGPIRWHAEFIGGATSRLGALLDEHRERLRQDDPDGMALVVHHEAEVADFMEETYGYRTDGQKTAAQKAADEAWAEQQAVMQHLKETDPEAYYAKRPWERPLSATEQAVRDAYDAEERKREERNAKARERRAREGYGRRQRFNYAAYEAGEQRRTAYNSGRANAHKINLEPFVQGGTKRGEIR